MDPLLDVFSQKTNLAPQKRGPLFIGALSRRCALSRSRRVHFLLDPLNRSSPKPERLGDLQNADPLFQLLLRLALKSGVNLWVVQVACLAKGLV